MVHFAETSEASPLPAAVPMRPTMNSKDFESPMPKQNSSVRPHSHQHTEGLRTQHASLDPPPLTSPDGFIDGCELLDQLMTRAVKLRDTMAVASYTSTQLLHNQPAVAPAIQARDTILDYDASASAFQLAAQLNSGRDHLRGAPSFLPTDLDDSFSSTSSGPFLDTLLDYDDPLFSPRTNNNDGRSEQRGRLNQHSQWQSGTYDKKEELAQENGGPQHPRHGHQHSMARHGEKYDSDTADARDSVSPLPIALLPPKQRSAAMEHKSVATAAMPTRGVSERSRRI